MSLSHFCTGPDPILFQVCSPFVFLSFVTIGVLSSITVWVFDFCHKLSFEFCHKGPLAESRAKDLNEKQVELAQLMGKKPRKWAAMWYLEWTFDLSCDIWSKPVSCDIWSEPLSCDIWSQPGSCITWSDLTESCDNSSELYVLKKTSYLKSFFLVSTFLIGHINYSWLLLSCS